MRKQKKQFQMIAWHGLLALTVITLLFSTYTLFMPMRMGSMANLPMQQMQEQSPHFGPRMTSFDLEMAKDFMDKDDDGKCDYCGMDVNLCISSGQLQCNMDPASTIGVLKNAHIHADFKVYVDGGPPIDFSIPEYDVKSMFAHVEGGNGDVIHFHATGVPLWFFFKSVGIEIPASASVLVNGKETAEKLDYVPQDKDKILITASSSTNIARELASITSWADRATA